MSVVMTEDQQVYTVKEVADILKINPRTVRRMIHDGELEAFTVRDEYRVRHYDLIAYMRRDKPQKDQ